MPFSGGWLTPFMIISGGNLASVAESSGANSTSRNFVPLSGGDTPIGRLAVSCLDKLGGVLSVIQKFDDEITGLSCFREMWLSNSATARFRSPTPVTTPRISDATAAAP